MNESWVGKYSVVHLLEPVREVEFDLIIHCWVRTRVKDVVAYIETIFSEEDLVARIQSEV